MKKTYFMTVLISGLVVGGLSESRRILIPKETDTPGTVAKDGRQSRLEKAREDMKQAWRNVQRKFDDKDQEGPLGEQYDGARSGTKDNVSQGSECMPPHVQRDQMSHAPSESAYLKEIASVLSIQVSKDDTPGDIAFRIKQCLGNAERYRGEVLSDESFELAKSAIGISADAEAFAEYHQFIKMIDGKRIIVLDSKE